MNAKNKKIITQPSPAPAKPEPLFAFSARTKYIILAVIGLFFYGNTLLNDYVLDDAGVILGNTYVQNGISGIYKIMTTDAYDSYLQQMHASQGFTGGRYRPLSIVIFAIEHSLFGNSALAGHLVNVVFFIATIFAIFYFLSNFLLKNIPRGGDCSFLAATLFAIHPLHTEVVANIKSFDEILSLLLILLTFIFSLLYIKQQQKKHLYFALGSFFLAMLSKEYAITLVVLLPLLFYLYSKQSSVISGQSSVVNASFKIHILAIPYFLTAFVYILLRISVVGIPHSGAGLKFINNQLRMDPYYLATSVQKFATEWYSLGKYLFMLFVPYPLACDYSYNQIPYQNFAGITTWLSIFAYAGIAYWGCKLLLKKDVMAFPVFFYLLMLFPVSNFFINVGAMFCERFDYHASLGFAVVISFLVIRLTKKVAFPLRKTAITLGLALLLPVCAYETITRNANWKNGYALFLHDVKVVPNSEFVNCNASAEYINLSLKTGYESRRTQMLDTAILLSRRAINVDVTFPDPFINAGLAYYYLSNLDSAKYFWDIIQQGLYPNHPRMKIYQPLLAKSFLNKAKVLGPSNPQAAINEMKKGISEDSTNAEIWYNLGGAFFSVRRYDSAQYAWTKTLQLNPDKDIESNTRNGLNALPVMQK